MKKGKQLYLVTIEKGRVTAYDSDKRVIPLTRSQRQTLTRYKQKTSYIHDINNEWHNQNVIHHDFSVVDDGKVVFTYTK